MVLGMVMMLVCGAGMVLMVVPLYWKICNAHNNGSMASFSVTNDMWYFEWYEGFSDRKLVLVKVP